MTDRRVVSAKLESLQRCIHRITSKTPPNAGELASNLGSQDIISLNLERAVQQCIDIAAHIVSERDGVTGQSAASLFADLARADVITAELAGRMGKAASFRNLLVHRYADIDWTLVYRFITEQLSLFEEFSRSVTKTS